jgi:hypothetical protein
LSILGVGKLGNDMKQTFLLTNILTNEETEIIDCNVPPPTTTYNNTLFITVPMVFRSFRLLS